MRYLERAFPWLLIAPAILPVVIWGKVVYPYLVPKTLLFYVLTLLTLAAFALLAAYGRSFYYARLSRWETWVPGALLSLAYVASYFGTDFYRSFWSLFIRGDGLLMLLSVTASYYLIVLTADAAFFTRLVRVVAAVGSFVAVYGIGEWIVGGGRIGSLLGNAAFFAGYLGIALFATLIAASNLSRGWRRTAYLGAALQVVAIILTATRGTMLALAVALVTALAYFALSASEAGKRRIAAQGALAAIVILAGLFVTFRSDLAHVPFQPVARLATIGTGDTDVASRLFIWKNMATQLEASPWLGVGAEHVDVLFNRFYDPTQIVEQWFDRSHNAFLDYAAQYGLGGLALYLALIASFFIAAWRFAKRGERRHALLISLLAITYAVQNFFVFDTVSSFWLFIAILASVTVLSLRETAREPLDLAPWTRGAVWAIAIALIYFIYPTSVKPAVAAYDLAQGYKYQLVDVAKEVSFISHGYALGTYSDIEYGYEAYDMYTSRQATALSGADLVSAYQVAASILTTNFNRYPYDARTAIYLAHVLTLAPAGASPSRDLLSAALERAIRLSPKRAQPWYILANLSISDANAYPPQSASRLEGYAAARDLLEKFVGLVPTLAEPRFVLAQLLYASGDPQGASAEAAKGKQYYASDLETAKRAAGYYETVLDLPSAAYFLAEVSRLDPTDTAAKADLEKIQAYERSKL